MADNETRVQKTKKYFENNPLTAYIILVFVVLAAIGAASGGIKAMKEVWFGVSSYVQDLLTNEPSDTSSVVVPAESDDAPVDTVAAEQPVVTPPSSNAIEGQKHVDQIQAVINKIETLKSQRQNLLAQRNMMMADNCDEIIANKQALAEAITDLLNKDSSPRTSTYRNELGSLNASLDECN